MRFLIPAILQCLALGHSLAAYAAPITSGLQLWLDAADNSTITTTNISGTDRVTQWSDKSANANHALGVGVPSTAGNPAYITSSNFNNAIPAIRYTPDTQQVLITQNNSPFSGGGFASSVFSVVRVNATPDSFSSVLSQSPGTLQQGMGYVIGSNQGNNAFTDVWAPGGRRVTAAGQIPINTGNGLVVNWEVPQWSTTNTTTRIYQDGALQATSAYGTVSGASVTAGPFRVGNWQYSGRPGDDMVFHGDIGEVLVYDRVLNTAERVITENYLASKFGLSTAVDRYDGDTPANFHFDFNVFGVGRRDDGANPGSVTSATQGPYGLTVNSGLDHDDFIMAGMRTPIFPLRVDTSLLEGDEDIILSFNVAELGLSGDQFRLLFSATDPNNLNGTNFLATNVNGMVNFNLLGSQLLDGYYFLDSVALTPEPTSILFGLTCCGAVAFMARNRRRARV